MSLTFREIEAIRETPPRIPSFLKVFPYLLYPLLKIPFTKKWIQHSSGGLSGQIAKCWKANNYEKATELSIFALERFRNKRSRLFPNMDHHFWWEFMNHGVESARQLDRPDFKEKLIELANNGIPPLEGFNVAFSFLQFSLWENKKENRD